MCEGGWLPNPSFVYLRINKNGESQKIKVMTSKEKFFQWLRSKESVSHTDIIIKLVKLDEVEEAKKHLNELKNEYVQIFGENHSAYDLTLETLPKKIIKRLEK
jgi:hypothetical protein